MRSDQQIVDQTEAVAAVLASAFRGYEAVEGATFRNTEHPKARQCWEVACQIQELLTDTDPENAVAELDDTPLEVAAPVTDAEIDASCTRHGRALLAGLTSHKAMRRALEVFAVSRVPVASTYSAADVTDAHTKGYELGMRQVEKFSDIVSDGGMDPRDRATVTCGAGGSAGAPSQYGSPEMQARILNNLAQPVQPAYDTRQFSNLANQAHGFARPVQPAEAQDTVRLDWLSLQDMTDVCLDSHDGEIAINCGFGPFFGKTLREAIDAAITAKDAKL